MAIAGGDTKGGERGKTDGPYIAPWVSALAGGFELGQVYVGPSDRVLLSGALTDDGWRSWSPAVGSPRP